MIAATNHLLKLRLQNYSGDSISFFKKNETAIELIYCNNPSTENLKEKAFCSSDKEKVQHIANVIRKEIDVIKGAFSNWPPPSDDLTYASVIPPLLQLLLRTLITTKSSVSHRVDRLINSIARQLDSSFNIESPIGHGWKLEDGNICIEWMMEKPAPNAILEFVSCN